MNQIFAKAALVLLTLAVPVGASPQSTLAGEWRNPHGTVVVRVSSCGNAYCGTISWASAHNREKGNRPGARVLTNLMLRPALRPHQEHARLQTTPAHDRRALQAPLLRMLPA